jgi:hypothetical protein
MLGIPHCLDSRLTGGCKVVSPRLRTRSTPQKQFSASGTLFCYRLSKPQGLVRPQGLGKFKKFIHLIASRTLDHLAGNKEPQPLRYRMLTELYSEILMGRGSNLEDLEMRDRITLSWVL